MEAKDTLCQGIAAAFNEAVIKVFDDIPNRKQVMDFFGDATAIIDAGKEAASWSQKDRLAGILRASAYLSLELSRSYARLSDEL